MSPRVSRVWRVMLSSGVVRESALYRSGAQVAATHSNAPRVVGVLGPGYHSPQKKKKKKKKKPFPCEAIPIRAGHVVTVIEWARF
jgi:hypothetical protein